MTVAIANIKMVLYCFKFESKKQCICYKYFEHLSSRIIIDVIIDPDSMGAGDF